MVVKRIVVDIATATPATHKTFYEDLFGLWAVMDQGWIVTLASPETGPVQISLASEGGSGADVPDLTIEVDDVDAVYRIAQHQNHPILYPLTDEPWGVRRFFVRDPAGKVLNIMAHL